MIDVLLVNPYVLRKHASRLASFRPYPPLGLMVVAAVLKQRGYRVEIYDGTFRQDPDEIVNRLRTGERAKIAGVYAMNSFREDALRTIKHLKEHGLLVIAGGPDPSIYDMEYLEAGADVVVRGEGEVALLEILDAFRLQPDVLESKREKPSEERLLAIPGVSILSSHIERLRAPERPASKDMDTLPRPAYELVDLDRYLDEWRRIYGYASIQFMTSRGCPFACTWCARPIFGRKYRQYDVVRAVDEIEWLVSHYKVEHLWLFDDTFVVRRAWVEDFCDELVSRKLRLRWECLARTDLVDRALLTKMRDAGCSRINFGLESGSQRILDGMKKGTNVADARRVAGDMHDLGIAMGGYVLFGYPGEDWKDIESTIGLIREIAPIDYSTSVALPMPGTEFHDLVHDLMREETSWEAQDPDGVAWQTPYSPGFYRLVETLLHQEYELALEFSVSRFFKAKLLRGALFALRALGDGKERVLWYRDEPLFKGWSGLRNAEKSARHRAGHAKKSERLRGERLKIVS